MTKHDYNYDCDYNRGAGDAGYNLNGDAYY